ncbi:MAG TPA: S8 family serine peptidase [Thermoanaerobaculia bacterium]|nr:S8 family serine peptidase [Thermoanaerobaculia bacterium]
MRTAIEDHLRRAGCWLALACLASATAFAAERYDVRLLGSTWTPPAGVSQIEVRSLTARADALRGKGQDTVHALVQLYRVPDESEREDLSRSGLDLGAYVPANSFIAAIPIDRIDAATRRPEVRWIEPWTADRKVHPRLRAGQVAPWARDPKRPEWVMTMVLLHADADLSRGAALAEAVGGVAMEPIEAIHGLTIWVPERNLAALAGEEEVLWIEEGPAPLTPTNDGIRSQMKVDPVLSSPYDLSGKGVKLFVFDKGAVRGSHPTFDAGSGSRVTVLDGMPSADHSTHVAGTAAGDGSGSAMNRGRGVAPLASILSAGYQQFAGTVLFWDNAGDIQTDYQSAVKDHGADLANNSLTANIAYEGYPCDVEGNYGVSSALVDQIVRGAFSTIGSPSNLIVVWANGNERSGGHGRCGANYHTTPEPACAKNPIAVGAVNSDGGAMTPFSSWGPCDDGRLKPTVSAPGCETGRVTGEAGILSSMAATGYGVMCGTSMAAPAVSGTLALLLEDWRLHGHAPLFPFANPRPLPALFKAMVIHTAKDLGVDGPDYRFGYGAVDAKALIDLQRAGGTIGSGARISWGTGSVATGQSNISYLDVPAGVGELKATLAWDDPAAAAFAATALVNDLDLEVIGPDLTTVYHPWVLDPAQPLLAAATGVNTVDNQEQVLVKNPQPGTWMVRVLGTSVPVAPQSFGLVYTATPVQFESDASCAAINFSFESGNDNWTLAGALRTAAPAPGHGAFSIMLGGQDNVVHSMQKSVALPPNASATWSFDAFLTTLEGANGFGYDELTAEVQDLSGTVLAVVNFNNDGDLTSTWLPQRNLDLSRWAGTTVKLVIRAKTSPANITYFWVDDVRVSTCPALTPMVSATFTSIAAHDGFVRESTETSNSGGLAGASNGPAFGAAVFLGDSVSDQQYKIFFSFDTSALPDGAALVSARLKLHRAGVEGTNPFITHGVCRVDVEKGGISIDPLLQPSDFQSAVSAPQAAVCSSPVPLAYSSFATLNSTGLAAINKTGLTQFRLYFSLGDNDDLSSDLVLFSPGEEPNPDFRPQLEIFYLP